MNDEQSQKAPANLISQVGSCVAVSNFHSHAHAAL